MPASLNPNHEVTQALNDVWFKVAAALLLKLSPHGIIITPEDIEKLSNAAKRNIVADSQPNGLHLYFVDDVEGKRLARQEGGLPS
jgi:hypothetical protein